MVYAVLDASGQCINRVLWDGEAAWEPPKGCTAVLDPDNRYPLIQDLSVAAPPAEEEMPSA